MSDPQAVPQCIGIILDGNRRWAKERGLPTLVGHQEGRETLKKAVRWMSDRSIKHVVVFLFSTENWNRDQEEVDYLMALFMAMVKKDTEELKKEGARIRIIGERSRFSADMQQAMDAAEKETAENTAITLWACLSYGGRAEIVDAAQKLAKSGEEITEASLRSHFWSADMPDPDIIIRTGGDKRISNFLLWQAAYAELFFIEPYWPDFSEALLDQVLEEYAGRQRRHGK